MHLIEIHIENFLSVGAIAYSYENKGLILVEGDNRDVESAKSNGSGKSNSFVDALTWCLFGQTTRGLGADTVLPKDGKGCRVLVKLETGGRRYKVARHRKHAEGKNQIHIHRWDDDDGWVDITRTTNPDTEKLLQSTIGVDRKTFLFTTIFGQGLTFRFSQLTDADRKQVLESITDLSVFDDARKLARKQAREVQGELDTMLGQLKEINASLLTHKENLRQVKADKKAHEAKIEERRGSIKEQIKEAEKKASDLLVMREDIKVESDLLKTMQETERKLREKINPLVKENYETQAQQNQVLQTLKRFEKLGALCSLCGSELTEEHRDAERERLSADHDALSAPILQLHEQIGKLEAQAEKVHKAAEEVEERVENAQTMRMKLEMQADQETRRADSLRRDLIRMDEDDHHTVLVERATQQLSEVQKRKDEVAVEMAQTTEKLQTLEFWVGGFQEIRIHVVDKMLAYLNARIAHYCDVMTDGEITASCLHNDKGQIEIRVTTRGGSYASASGGEKDRIDIAIAFALHDLATQQTEFRSNVLVLDEVAVFVDDAGIERLMRLVAEKLDRVETCFLVSQNPEFKGFADTVWTVVKEEGVSRLEVA